MKNTTNFISQRTFLQIQHFSNFHRKNIYEFEVSASSFIPEMLPLPSQFQLLIQEKAQKLIWSSFHFPILSIVESYY